MVPFQAYACLLLYISTKAYTVTVAIIFHSICIYIIIHLHVHVHVHDQLQSIAMYQHVDAYIYV